MNMRIPIGDFSRMTHLTIKTLRHYHDVGLLVPANIDPASGYRYYARSQVPAAQIIRRFRELGMPVDDVRAMLQLSDAGERSTLMACHLDRLEAQLHSTQRAVTALRTLLERPDTPIRVEHRSVAATAALAISERVAVKNVTAWITAAFTEIYAVLAAQGVQPTGPAGGLFANDIFHQGEGDATMFIPVHAAARGAGRVQPLVIPAAELAVTVHDGADASVALTYGALGTYVTQYELGVDSPMREYYLVDHFHTPDATLWRTEIAWPVFHAKKR